jgi:hypothetical protein
MFFILPLGIPGLNISDLDPHLYEGLEEVSNGAELIEDSIGVYRIENLPSLSPVIRQTLTVEYPEGVGYSFVWGGEENGTPEAVIIPVKEVGLTEGDFTFVLYRNQTIQNIALSVGNSLQPNGDYPISGWPVERNSANWVLGWSLAGSGVFSFYVWQELAPITIQGSVISVSALHPPYDIGVDETQRSYFSCNFALKLNGLFQFDRAFARYLESEGFGTVDLDIFYGKTVAIPTTGQTILVLPQSGYSTQRTNDNGNIVRPVMQVLVFDPQRDEAQRVANEIFEKLDVMTDTQLNDD